MPKPPHIKNMYQRFWVINPHTLNCYQPITDAQQVIVLPIPKTALTATSASFLQFNKENPQGSAYMLIFQTLLYSVYKIRDLAEERKLMCDQYTQIRLETLYSNDEAAPKVIGYRLFIFMMTKQITLGECLEELFKENRLLYQKYDSPNSVTLQKGAGMRLPGSKDWRSRLWPHEYYRFVKDKAMWAGELCDFYVGKTRTASQMDKVLSDIDNLGHAANPANPANIFNIARAILKNSPPNLHPLQKNIENYRFHDIHSGRTSYKFPDLSGLSHHLLKIQYSEAQPSIFCYKWLPEYQVNKLNKLQEQLLKEFPILKQTWDSYAREVTENPNHLLNADNTNDSALQSPEEAMLLDICQTDMIHDQPVEGEKPFQMKTLIQSHLDTASELLNNRVFQYFYTSDFRMLEEENRTRLDDLKKIVDAETYSRAYAEYEKEAFDNFLGRCWTSDADISEIGHIIRSWGNSPDVKDFKIRHSKFDPTLSVFANQVARKMEYLENYSFMSTSHKQFLIMIHGRLDSYRQSTDLHFNGVLDGNAGTSKSYCLELLEKMSIEGTVEQITYQTLRADAIDRDNNDTITIMHEIPKDMTEKNIGGNNTLESSFKERLTSLRVKVKLFQKDEGSGFRDQRISVSECIGTWWGATNEDISKMDEALVTRFFQLHFTEANREHRDIMALMNAQKNLLEKEKQKLKSFYMEMKVEQYRYYLVEKLIMTHCLPEFNTKNAQVYFGQLFKALRSDGYTPHPRTKERMIIMTRILSICLALETLYNIPTAPYYNKPFEISQLKDIKPYLFPPVEVMQFVVGLFADQLVNPIERDVLITVKSMHENPKETRRFRQYYDDSPAHDATATGDGVPIDEAHQQAANPTTIKFGVDPNTKAGVSSIVNKNKKVDYNYVAINKNIHNTSVEIYNQMDQCDFRPSAIQIKALLTQMKKRMIKSKNYIKESTDKEPKRAENSIESKGAAVMTDHDGTYFHYSLLENLPSSLELSRHSSHVDSDKQEAYDAEKQNNELISKYVKDMWYEKTLKQRTIFGVTKPKHPHLFEVLSDEPNTNKTLVIFNVLYIDESSKDILYNDDEDAYNEEDRRGKEMDIFSTDIDTDSLRDQLIKLEMPDDEDTLKKYHPYTISIRENDWLAKTRGVSKKDGKYVINRTHTYPTDNISNYEKRKRKFELAMQKRSSKELQAEYSDYFNINRKRQRKSDKGGFTVPNFQINLAFNCIGMISEDVLRQTVEGLQSPQTRQDSQVPAVFTINSVEPDMENPLLMNMENPLLMSMDAEPTGAPAPQPLPEPVKPPTEDYWLSRSHVKPMEPPQQTISLADPKIAEMAQKQARMQEGSFPTDLFNE